MHEELDTIDSLRAAWQQRDWPAVRGLLELLTAAAGLPRIARRPERGPNVVEMPDYRGGDTPSLAKPWWFREPPPPPVVTCQLWPGKNRRWRAT